MDGRALTAGELAWHAGVSAQTTSGHLAKLVEAQLVAVVRQGRHRYHRLASAEVARAVEAVSALAAIRPGAPPARRGRATRRCVRRAPATITWPAVWPWRSPTAWLPAGHLDLGEAEGVGGRSGDGVALLPAILGIELGPSAGRRPLCRICLDWSERRPHLRRARSAPPCGSYAGAGLDNSGAAHARGSDHRDR